MQTIKHQTVSFINNLKNNFTIKQSLFIMDLDNLISFYHAMLRRARYCYGKSSVRVIEVSWSYTSVIFKNSFTIS